MRFVVPRLPRAMALLCAAALLAGCVSEALARKVVAPPNHSGITPLFADLEILKLGPATFAQTWTVATAAPVARIAVATVEPGDYGLVYDLSLAYADGEPPRISYFDAHWLPVAKARLAPPPARGTILLLHGYLQNRNYMVPWAVRLAEAGFRCVLVDLRGHGESTGSHISFGAFEARDLGEVLDDLARRGWDVSRIGMLGVSYGASVALVTAGRDARVAAVVALEPFASAERAVPELMRAAFPREARGISDRQFALAHVKEARIAGFDWADADVAAALHRTHAPVWFIHGASDDWISPEHSRELYGQAPTGSRLTLVPRDNHVSIPLQVQTFAPGIVAWFDAALRAP
jgi:pimeloyl-ACP methyl ester carboxylesterase